jgi:hypothetical protein
MTTTPYVELSFHPTDLRPRDLPKIGEFLGTPSDAIEAALMVTRLRMIEQMKYEVRGLAEPTHAQMLRMADLAWQAAFWRYRKISAPIMADAYIRAYRAAGAGDVPMSVIYDLADKHAEKIGDYFHGSSRDALAEGFNTLVNRQVPAKAAADRVLDAYGLTPRQMRGYTSNKQFRVPVESVSPLDVKARARAYIDKSFHTRARKLARQEEHNIDEQAKQFAWMWMQDKGKLGPKAQKMWITAKDERVCPVCGPLHGQKAGINEQFRTAEGLFWTPGLHPNCRCVVRLIENRFSKVLVRKDDWDPREHPRGGDPENRGRFSRVAEQDRRPVINVAEPDVIETTTETPVNVRPVVNVRASARLQGLQAPVNVRAPVNVQAPVVNVVTTPVNVGAEPVNVLGLLRPKTAVAPTVTDVTVVPNKPKTKMTPYQEVRPLDEAYYRVVSGDPGFHQFDRETFSADRDQIILDAATVREQAIDDVLRQHSVGGWVKYTEATGSYGVPLTAKIPEEEFRNILEVLAQQGTSEPPHDALIDVDYYDPDGQDDDAPLETTGRTVLDIAHAVGVDPEHLKVNVIRIDAVHSENVGRGTAQRGQVVGHPYDEYEITGDYSLEDWEPEYEEGTGTPVGMDIYTVYPHDPAIGYMEEPAGDYEKF